jgi:predicted metal-dependent HD superfamily phosphohydrolase
MISHERLDLARQQWVALLGSYGVLTADAHPPLDRLVAAYSEPHRHYHTLEHLAEMFQIIDRMEGPDTDSRPVRLAAWYHDVVYDPRAKDNEARSADLAVRELTAVGMPTEEVEIIHRLVLATDYANSPPAIDSNTAVLRDADWAILGSSEVRYNRYTADIRKEYAWVPQGVYRTGRVGVLRRFLSMPLIYSTGLMVAEREQSARRNVLGEIAELTRASESG